MRWLVEEVDIRMECLRLAVEFGTQRDLKNPQELADKYYEWVKKGSLPTSPSGNRKDDRPIESVNQRSVRKGSTSKVA
tara:strand:- start:2023 stop:2256 length:234 start_codon:yes stop_codon:yes gene_type:complete